MEKGMSLSNGLFEALNAFVGSDKTQGDASERASHHLQLLQQARAAGGENVAAVEDQAHAILVELYGGPEAQPVGSGGQQGASGRQPGASGEETSQK